MAQFPLSELRTYWKNISDWIKGVDSVSRPKVDAQLTGRKVNVAVGEYDQLLNIDSNTAVVVTISPPAGELWRMKLLFIRTEKVIGATEGDVSVSIGTKEIINGETFSLNVKSNFDKVLEVKYNSPTVSSSYVPNDKIVFANAIQSMVFTNECPMVLYIGNYTDVNMNDNVRITIVREVEYVDK